MKFISFFLLLILVFSCKNATTENNDAIVEVTASTKKENILEKQKNDSSNIQIVKAIFNDTKVINKKATDSLLLFSKYKCNISKQSNPIRLSFPKCLIFSSQQDFNNEFTLKETSVWYEEKLEHTNLFYLDHKNKHIIVVDLLKATTFKECNISEGSDFILDAIRIFKKDEYAEKSKKSNSPFYSFKM